MSWESGQTRLLGAGSAAFLAAVALWATLPAPRARRPPPAPVPGAVVPGLAGPAPAAGSEAPHPSDEPSTARALPPAPRSLRGTDVDGGLTVDADGAFVPDRDALALFHYFLAASGEEPESVIRERILDQIHARLSEEAARSAARLLDDYLGYRDALRELARTADAPRDLERRLQWIRELRRRHLGEETAEALFGEEELVTSIDLERRRVAADDTLSTDERAQRLAALDALLPEPVRQARERARAPRRARDEVAALRAGGASEDEVFAARERRFGWEAAQRLAELDARRADWERRLASYRAEREALIASDDFAMLDEETRGAELASLRSAHFAGAEAQRVEAMERFGR